ncbi:hypothetical protein BCR34DRAFT_648639 [Clohesyomyces aquaticus]|uniref:Rhodopsin domain-containing protein n=1 Tax=Clohesyomyces aquaticus TaxID=1231657 RepID=A0A1Y1ZU64_9PLEO|nr:hypothetical protein BCR34DRAFT_648639 [Clohesyomyces aquaticus]
MTIAIPLPFLRSLQSRLSQKICVALVMVMGAFVCAVSIVRLSSPYQLLRDKNLTRG